MAGEPDHGEGGLAAADRDAIARPQGDLHLAVDDQHGREPLALGRDLVDLVPAVDQGALGEGVRADGGDDEHVGVGGKDRASCREAVGRRADRGGDDQAVAAIGHHALAVDRQADVDQVEDRGRPDDRVVEAAERAGGAAARSDDARQRHQVVDGELPRGQVFQPLLKRRGRQVGQEPEPARVDAQNGRGMVFHPPRRVEHGAVAAEHDRHVGGQGREVGVGRKIDADQLDPVGVESTASAIALASAWTSGLIPLPRMTNLSGRLGVRLVPAGTGRLGPVDGRRSGSDWDRPRIRGPMSRITYEIAKVSGMTRSADRTPRAP